MTLVIGPSVIFCGASVTITKQYRPQLWLGWVILTVAMGALATLEWDSNLGKSIGLSSLTQVGAGLLQAATYFPVLAPLPVSKNAHALAFFAFCRTFAGVRSVCSPQTTHIINLICNRSGVSRLAARSYRTSYNDDSPPSSLRNSRKVLHLRTARSQS